MEGKAWLSLVMPLMTSEEGEEERMEVVRFL